MASNSCFFADTFKRLDAITGLIMGIRFHCPNGHKLHVKAFLAGKRGICPECGVSVEIPNQSALEGMGGIGQAGTVGAVVSRDAVWFVRTSAGEQYGPADTPTFREWVREGRVAPDCLVWQEGWPDWKPASEALAGQNRDRSPLAVTPPPVEVPSLGGQAMHAFSIAVDPDPAVVVGRKAKRRSRTLVFLLMVACLVLLVPLIYVVTVKT